MSEMTDQYQLTDLLQGLADEAESRSPSAGQVWAALRRQDGCAVVIKLVADADRARREADIARAVDHAHVIVPEAIVETGDATGLVTPLAAGGSIASLLDARGRLPWAEVLTVLIPIADALAAAHERDLIHGDISTGNILLDGSGRPLLADFGASRAAAEQGGFVAVTPTTAAPELARGATPDARSDLFALGAVAMWCLTGRPAWPADDLRDVLVQSAAGQWPDVPDSMAPAPLIAAVRQLLTADPGARGSAAELAVTLRRVGTPEPVGGIGGAGAAIPATMVRPDALRPPAGRGSVSRPRRAVLPMVVGGAIAVALLAGALTVGWWWAGADGTGATVVAAAPRGVDSSAAPSEAGPATSTAATSASTWTAASGTAAPPSETGPSAAPTADTGQTSQSALAPIPVEDEEPDTASAAPEPEEPDWRAVVENLDWARAAALQARNKDLLGEVYLDGAAARRGDEERIAALRAAGLRPDLAIHRIDAVTVVDRLADGSVTLAVRSSLPAVTIYDDDGSDAGHTLDRGAQRILMTVVPGSDGYRIVAIDE